MADRPLTPTMVACLKLVAKNPGIYITALPDECAPRGEHCRGIPAETLERAIVTVLTVPGPGVLDVDGRMSAPVPTPRYVVDLSSVGTEQVIREKLFELGWTPPEVRA